MALLAWYLVYTDQIRRSLRDNAESITRIYAEVLAPSVEKAIEIHREYLMNETLATTWQVGQSKPRYTAEKTMGEEPWTIEITL